MIWTLTNGDDVFEIANGADRACRVDESADGQMTQDTPNALRLRAAFLTAFTSRVVREFTFDIPVTFPESSSAGEAFMQSITIPATCPPGGVLVGELNGDRVTFSQAWVSVVPWRRTGVTNRFVFSIRAVNPVVTSLYVDAAGDSYLDEDDEIYTP